MPFTLSANSTNFSVKKKVKYSTRFSKATRKAVAKASDGLPYIGTWLKRIEAIGDPALNTAIEGIWCGHSGEVRIDIPGSNAMLCMGWYKSKVEWSYLS